MSKPNCTFAFLLFWLFTLFSLNAFAQGGIPPGTASTDTGLGGVNVISGMVLSPNGGRMERRVSIRLQSMTKGDRISTTDEYGNFRFAGVPSGDYIVLIDKEKDFETLAQPVTVIQPRGMPPQTYNLSLRLTRKAGTDAKPEVLNAETAGIPKHAVDLYNKAIELGNGGDRKGAVVQLKLAIEEAPKFMLAHNEMGVQYMKLGDLPSSDEAFAQALKLDPQAYMPMMNRGIVLFMLRKFAEAVPVLREASAIKPNEAVGHYFLGQALANLGKFVEAEKELQSAIKFGGDEVKEAHRLLAIIYGYSGDNKAAAEELEIYLKLAPKAPDAEHLRHRILQLKGIEKPPGTQR